MPRGVGIPNKSNLLGIMKKRASHMDFTLIGLPYDEVRLSKCLFNVLIINDTITYVWHCTYRGLPLISWTTH